MCKRERVGGREGGGPQIHYKKILQIKNGWKGGGIGEGFSRSFINKVWRQQKFGYNINVGIRVELKMVYYIKNSENLNLKIYRNPHGKPLKIL